MGVCPCCYGGHREGRRHLDQAIALYDPAEHRPLATRFGQDVGVACLVYRSLALWLLGYPEAALADAITRSRCARDRSSCHVDVCACPNKLYLTRCAETTRQQTRKSMNLSLWRTKKARRSGRRAECWYKVGFWPDRQSLRRGSNDHLRDQLHCGQLGATLFVPFYLSYLARAYAELGQFDDAWRCIGEAITAMETTKERWCEAEVHRIAGEIALKSPEPDAAKAEAYFERALAVARQQQAKSWELRAAMSMARLWRDQGKRDEARDLLAPVYGWFTEGFDTLDLKEAKALLDELAA